MKKNLFFYLLSATIVFLGTTSCVKETKNFTTGSFAFTTFVSVDKNGNKVFEKDFDACFYSTETNADKNLMLGDRVLLNRYTLDRDDQPAGATGSQANPVLLTAVQHEKISTDACKKREENDLTEITDTLTAFFLPRISHSINDRTYITIGGNVLKNVSKSYNLYQDESNNDTLIYNLKVKFSNIVEGDNSTAIESFFKCFYVPTMKSEQIVKINFPSHDHANGTSYIYFPSKSSVVLKAPKIYETNN